MNKSYVGTFLAVGLLMGILLTWHFNTKVPIEGNFPSDEVQARDALLKSFLDEQSYLQSRIVSLRKEIEEAQNQVHSQSEKADLEYLESLKTDIGLTEVTCTGLE